MELPQGEERRKKEREEEERERVKGLLVGQSR
jgi:hypothetical protein